MNADMIAYITMTAVISGSLGFLGAAVMAASRNKRIAQDSWNQARLFYSRQQDPSTRRL